MKKFFFPALLMLLFTGALSGCMNPSAEPITGEIVIAPLEEHQIIEGFGASAAWWAQEVGGWEEEQRKEIIRLLFNRETGIGLSIYRYNIGAGIANNIQDPWRTAETFEVSPGKYDWSRDANAVWVMKAAQAEGADQFVAFVNSPPARMTVSGLTTGGVKGVSNLRPEMYAQFAQYMVDVVRHLRDDEGIPIGWISPVNEPQWNWSFENAQEGCHYGPAEVLEVTRALIRAVEANKLDVKISVFESGEWKKSQVYIDKLLKDPEVAPRLEHIAIHSYWSKEEDKRPIVNYLDRNFPGTKIWQTEWTEMKEGRDTGMESALVLANTIHEDLSFDHVTSWQYWIAVSRYFYRDGLIYVNLSDRSMTETKRLWAMGNYSRYIRPGSRRIGASSNDSELKAAAFRSPDRSRYILVVINHAKTSAVIKVSGLPVEFARVAQYETSARHDLEMIAAGSLPASYALAPESVTTLVFSPP